MPGYLRRDPLGDAEVDHVPNRRSPEIMPQHPRAAYLHTCGLPSLLEVLNLPSAVWTPEIREQVRNDLAYFPFQAFHRLNLGRS